MGNLKESDTPPLVLVAESATEEVSETEAVSEAQEASETELVGEVEKMVEIEKAGETEAVGETEEVYSNEVSDDNRMLFITNKRNLLSFLGAGMVVPSDVQFRYKKDSREMFNGAIGIWKTGLPDLRSICQSGDWGEVVLIEFREDSLNRFKSCGLVYSDENVMVFNGPLPLSAVKSIVFEDHADIEDFCIRLPVDVLADPTLFIAEKYSSFQQLGSEQLFEFKGTEDPKLEVINFVDRFGGALRVIDVLAPDNPRAIDYSRVLSWIFLEHLGLLEDPNRDREEGVSVSVEDKAIVEALIEILSNQRPEQDIDVTAILEKVEKKLAGDERLDHRALDSWLAFSRSVLKAERDVPELGDGGDILKRGVLLFLLRPGLDRLAKSKSSLIRPGDAVYVVALFLAGFLSGMARLGPAFKSELQKFNHQVSNLLDALWCDGNNRFNSVKELHRDGSVSVVLNINDIPIWKRTVKKNPLLAYVLQKAKIVGYELEYDYMNHRLVYHMSFEDGRSQTVYLELISPLKGGAEVIRFFSPCQDISGSKKGKLKKSELQKILAMNSQRNMYCSFGLSDELDAVVVQAAQIVRSMDDIEFETLINEVAKAADEYERDVLGTDVY